MMKPDRKAHIHAENSGTMLTRRSVLKGTGSIIAAMAFPPVVRMTARWLPPAGAEQPGSVMAELSRYMSEARGRALPDEVTEKVKQHVLDTLAAMVSGSELPPGRAAVRFAREYGGFGDPMWPDRSGAHEWSSCSFRRNR